MRELRGGGLWRGAFLLLRDDNYWVFVLTACLSRGIAAEQIVRANSLVDGEECWLSNGGRGFYFGKVKLS